MLTVFATTRLLTFLLFLAAAYTQGDNYWTKARPSYFDFLNIWDVEWYGKIFSHGYPLQLPLHSDGAVAPNEWAFLPGFPASARAFAFSGLEWKYLAPILATLFAAAFALVAYRVFATKLSEWTALLAVALLLVSPASPILQTGYAESLGLLLLALVFYFWLSDRLLLTAIAMLGLAFTRPGLAAIALGFSVVWVYRYVAKVRGEGAFSLRAAVRLGVLAFLALLLNFAWPALAAIYTGRTDAYLQTELAWRHGYPFDGGGITPLLPWFSSAQYFVGGSAGLLLVIAALVGSVAIFFLPSVRALGLELNAMVAAYFVYLFLFFFPQSSILRILLPTFPLFGALAIALDNRSKLVKWVTFAALIVGQVIWLLTCWRYQAPDFSPP